MPTVGSHQQGAFATPVNGQSIDASVVLSNDNANRTTTNAHDADATIHVQSSLLASRPAAGTAGRPWITSDGLRFYLDSGSVWNELDYLSKTGGGTVAGAVTLSATLTAAAASFSGAVTVASTVTLTANATYLTGRTAGAVDKRVIGINASDKVIIDADGLGAIFAGSVTANGGVTVSAGGLTVSSGTTAVQALTATTGAFSGGAVTVNNTSDSYVITNANTSGNAGYYVNLDGTEKFRIDVIRAGSARVRFLVNAAATEAISIAQNGAVTVATGLTVSSGTTAVQALTATTGTFSSAVSVGTTLGVTSAASFFGTVTVSSGLTDVQALTVRGALTVTTSGVTVSAGGLAVTGNSTITGTLGGITTLTATSLAGTLTTAAQPNITSVGVLASPHMTSPVIDSGGLTVTAGGIAVTGGHLIVQKHGMFGAWDGSGDGFSLHVSKDTAGTATGGAQTLPANPAGFLTWILGATTIKVPYYNN